MPNQIERIDTNTDWKLSQKELDAYFSRATDKDKQILGDELKNLQNSKVYKPLVDQVNQYLFTKECLKTKQTMVGDFLAIVQETMTGSSDYRFYNGLIKDMQNAVKTSNPTEYAKKFNELIHNTGAKPNPAYDYIARQTSSFGTVSADTFIQFGNMLTQMNGVTNDGQLENIKGQIYTLQREMLWGQLYLSGKKWALGTFYASEHMQSLERDLLQSTTLQKYPDFVALAEEIKIMETKIDTDVNKQPPEGTMIFLQERFDRIFNKIAPKLSPETRKKIKEQRGEKMKWIQERMNMVYSPDSLNTIHQMAVMKVVEKRLWVLWTTITAKDMLAVGKYYLTYKKFPPNIAALADLDWKNAYKEIEDTYKAYRIYHRNSVVKNQLQWFFLEQVMASNPQRADILSKSWALAHVYNDIRWVGVVWWYSDEKIQGYKAQIEHTVITLAITAFSGWVGNLVAEEILWGIIAKWFLQKALLFSAELAISGGLFHPINTTLNAIDSGDWKTWANEMKSPKAWAKSIAYMGVMKWAAMAFGALGQWTLKLAQKVPASLFTSLKSGIQFGVEVGAMMTTDQLISYAFDQEFMDQMTVDYLYQIMTMTIGLKMAHKLIPPLQVFAAHSQKEANMIDFTIKDSKGNEVKTTFPSEVKLAQKEKKIVEKKSDYFEGKKSKYNFTEAEAREHSSLRNQGEEKYAIENIKAGIEQTVQTKLGIKIELSVEDMQQIKQAHLQEGELGKLTNEELRAKVEYLRNLDFWNQTPEMRREIRRILLEAGFCGALPAAEATMRLSKGPSLSSAPTKTIQLNPLPSFSEGSVFIYNGIAYQVVPQTFINANGKQEKVDEEHLRVKEIGGTGTYVLERKKITASGEKFSKLLPINRNMTRKEASEVERFTEVVAIGDLHGDYAFFVKNMVESNLAKVKEDGSLEWIAENTNVQFLGDILGDRGSEGLKIIKEIEKLKSQAQEKGSTIDVIDGNHDDFLKSFLVEDYALWEGQFGVRESNGMFVDLVQHLSTESSWNQVIEIVKMPKESRSQAIEIFLKEHNLLSPENSKALTEAYENANMGKKVTGILQFLIDKNLTTSDVLVNFRIALKDGIILPIKNPEVMKFIKEQRSLIIKNIAPEALKWITSGKILEQRDDTLFMHTNPTKEIMDMIHTYTEMNGGDMGKAIEYINTVYQQGLESSMGLRKEFSPTAQKEFNDIRKIFLSSDNNKNAESSEMYDYLQEHGINRILNGHNQGDKVTMGNGVQQISIDVGRNGKDKLATAKIDRQGMNILGEYTPFEAKEKTQALLTQTISTILDNVNLSSVTVDDVVYPKSTICAIADGTYGGILSPERITALESKIQLWIPNFTFEKVKKIQPKMILNKNDTKEVFTDLKMAA